MAAATNASPPAPDALGDDVLKRLAEREAQGRADDLESMAGLLEAPRDRLARALEQLARDGWLERAGSRYELTAVGRTRGRPGGGRQNPGGGRQSPDQKGR